MAPLAHRHQIPPAAVPLVQVPVVYGQHDRPPGPARRLALALGVNPRSVERWLAGRRRISRRSAAAIRAVLASRQRA